MFPGFFDMMKNATINDMPQLLKDAYLKINPDTNGLMAMFTKDRDRMLNYKDWPDEMLKSIKAPALILSGVAESPDPGSKLPEMTVQIIEKFLKGQ
eukprot:gene15696-20060_t